MIGAKPGDRVLVIGATDPDLVAALAGVTGLNGTTLVAGVDDAAQSLVRQAAEQAGTLVEFGPASLALVPPGSFDIVVLLVGLRSLEPGARTATARAGFEAARDGGRVVAIEGRRRTGFFGSRTKSASPEAMPAPDVTALLASTGGRAVRLLADAEGASYFEARK